MGKWREQVRNTNLLCVYVKKKISTIETIRRFILPLDVVGMHTLYYQISRYQQVYTDHMSTWIHDTLRPTLPCLRIGRRRRDKDQEVGLNNRIYKARPALYFPVMALNRVSRACAKHLIFFSTVGTSLMAGCACMRHCSLPTPWLCIFRAPRRGIAVSPNSYTLSSLFVWYQAWTVRLSYAGVIAYLLTCIGTFVYISPASKPQGLIIWWVILFTACFHSHVIIHL